MPGSGKKSKDALKPETNSSSFGRPAGAYCFKRLLAFSMRADTLTRSGAKLVIADNLDSSDGSRSWFRGDRCFFDVAGPLSLRTQAIFPVRISSALYTSWRSVDSDALGR